MLRSIAAGMLLLALAPLAWAADIENAQITLKAGDSKVLNAPVTLPYDGDAPDGRLYVVDETTGKEFAATIRDGEFVFVPEGAMPNTEHTYTVKVGEASAAPRVRVAQQGDKPIVDVFIDDVHFTSYHYSNEYKKPFLWPVNAAGQVGVTRDWPMGEQEGNKGKDHPHHKSLYAAYGEISLLTQDNGEGGSPIWDCWGEGKNSGFQHSGEVTFGSGDAYGWIKAKNTWQDKDHNALLTEEREYRFYATPEDARLLDAFVTFTADRGPVMFHDTKEGGIMAVRMRPELSYENAVITNAHGDVGEANTWGKPAAWCDYSGNMDGVGWRGLAVFDHPSNLRHPTSWHVRDYGLMGANPFGYSYFKEKAHNEGLLPMENGDYLIKNKEQLQFTHRVYVHSGNVEEAAVADRYADFASPPEAKWVE